MFLLFFLWPNGSRSCGLCCVQSSKFGNSLSRWVGTRFCPVKKPQFSMNMLMQRKMWCRKKPVLPIEPIYFYLHIFTIDMGYGYRPRAPAVEPANVCRTQAAPRRRKMPRRTPRRRRHWAPRSKRNLRSSKTRLKCTRPSWEANSATDPGLKVLPWVGRVAG